MAGEGLDHVRDRHDPAEQGALAAGEAVGVAAAVPAFVVREAAFRDGAEGVANVQEVG